MKANYRDLEQIHREWKVYKRINTNRDFVYFCEKELLTKELDHILVNGYVSYSVKKRISFIMAERELLS